MRASGGHSSRTFSWNVPNDIGEVGYAFKCYENREEPMTKPSYSTSSAEKNVTPIYEVTLKAESVGKRKNTISFSAQCKRLGAPLKNVADRWCGLSEENRMAVFTVWADRLKGGKYLYKDNVESPKDTRIGAKELGVVIEAVMKNGYDAYGILSEAKDPTAKIRKRGYFCEDTLLVLRFVNEAAGVVAYVQGEVAVAGVLSGLNGVITAFPSAVDDLGAPPPGVERPDRVHGVSSGYRRDDAVRQFVLRRARGKCEYCETPGFELPDGSGYLEAHHIIALAKDGRDKVNNVIALCAHHHREAHYGRDAEKLEASFMEKLRALAS